MSKGRSLSIFVCEGLTVYSCLRALSALVCLFVLKYNIYYCSECSFCLLTGIPYSRKYWRELYLAVWFKKNT